jgi:antirestriction protein ArdC
MINKKKEIKMNKQDLMKKVADKVIKAMDNHGTKWLCPWSKLGLPKNIRGSFYTGINTFILWAIQEEYKYKSLTFATFKQIKDKGGKVNKGEKAHQVVFFTPLTYQKENASGEMVDKTFAYMKFYNVFNLDQTTLEDNVIAPDGADTLPNVEQYIKNTKADIRYDNQLFVDKCYYVPSLDYIGMVTKEKFNNADGSTATQNFYATILHELTHWTGHKSRCNRDEKYKAKYFDDMNKYAFEELVAELGAVIQSTMLGVTMEPTKHACQYLNIWKSRIKDDPSVMFKASAFAQAGVNHILKLQENTKQKVA